MTLQTHVTGSSSQNEASKVLSITESGTSSHSTTITTITDEAPSYEYTLPENTDSTLSIFNSTSNATKRYQTKMLLASLIEHFCRAYGDTPDANRKVFFLICQTLRSLGIIDAEFMDEMASVRSSFQQAFHKLFFTAVQTVRNQDLVHFNDHLPKMIQPPTINNNSLTLEIPKPTKTPHEDYFSSPVGTTFTSSPPSSSANKMHPFIHGGNLSVQNSRYNNDFVEISLLGKGGFASAFRARNKLDGIDYAVKKIRLGNDIEDNGQEGNPYEKIFREIKNLARLEHVNVIRYYSSWLEYDESSNDPTDTSDWEDDTSRHKSFLSTDSSSSVFGGCDPTFDQSGMSQIQFGTNDGMYDQSGISQIQFEKEPMDQSVASIQFGDDNTSVSSVVPSCTRTVAQSGWTLFIQMQLCPTTLHDYIKLRNKKFSETSSYGDLLDKKRNIEIFSQILQGTAYIHDQGLIHRDLKPSNIFLSMPNLSAHDGKRKRASNAFLDGHRSSVDSSVSENGTKESMWEEAWVPKIGDFGLAAEAMDEGDGVLVPTPMSSTPPSPKILPKDDYLVEKMRKSSVHDGRPKRPKPKRTRTVGVGTRTYASPEQLAVPVQPYDEKVDIYSLGIILFELFQPFATGMERADSIEKLKHGVFPDGFLELYPKVSALIIWMMDEKPHHRPTAQQLLEFELFSHPDDADIYSSLQTQLLSKTNMIDELKKTVERVQREKEEALNEMQQRLDAMRLELNALQRKELTSLKKKKEVRWCTFNSE